PWRRAQPPRDDALRRHGLLGRSAPFRRTPQGRTGTTRSVGRRRSHAERRNEDRARPGVATGASPGKKVASGLTPPVPAGVIPGRRGKNRRTRPIPVARERIPVVPTATAFGGGDALPA